MFNPGAVVSFVGMEAVGLLSLCALGPAAIPILLIIHLVVIVGHFVALLAERLSTKIVLPPLKPMPTFEKRTCKSHDGLTITLYIAKSDALLSGIGGSNGDAADPILFASPLGQHGPSSFAPLITALAGQKTLISWDYRGFWGSEAPRRLRQITIHEHALDAAAVLAAAGFDRAAAVIGHSLGVQVA
jgi:hypothetical protein